MVFPTNRVERLLLCCFCGLGCKPIVIQNLVGIGQLVAFAHHVIKLVKIVQLGKVFHRLDFRGYHLNLTHLGIDLGPDFQVHHFLLSCFPSLHLGERIHKALVVFGAHARLLLHLFALFLHKALAVRLHFSVVCNGLVGVRVSQA